MLRDHPLSAVCDCLFNAFAATLHIGGHSSSATYNLPCHGDRDPLIMGECFTNVVKLLLHFYKIVIKQ